MNRKTILIVCLAGAACLGLAALIGCKGSAGPGVIIVTDAYGVTGLLVEDWNLFATRATVNFSRNDTMLDSGLVWLGDYTLAFAGDNHVLSVEPSGSFPQGAYNLVVADRSDFVDTVVVDIADTFSVDVSDPPNRENPGGDVVTIDWTESPGTDAYVMAAVPRHLAYTGTGYSEWVGSSEGTIPIDAFRWSNGVDVDTGWYYLFAYAYVGSPDSASSAEVLPVPLPSERTENVDQEPLSGRFGAVVVAGRDSVYVTTQ